MLDAASFSKLNALSTVNSSFTIEGAANIVAETVKISEADAFTSTGSKGEGREIVVRLYEAFGGHAKFKLKVSVFFAAVLVAGERC